MANWIANVVKKNPGGLHRAFGVPQGKKIPEGRIAEAAKGKGHVARMARFAKQLAGFRKS